PRPVPERTEPGGHRAALADPRAAPVPADDLGLERVQAQEFERLRVLARGDLHVVAVVPQKRDERPEDEHVRARRHVDPDADGLPRSRCRPGRPCGARDCLGTDRHALGTLPFHTRHTFDTTLKAGGRAPKAPRGDRLTRVRRRRALHRSASTSGKRTSPSAGARSTCRSYHSVNARRPHSCRERSSRPETWSSRIRPTASGEKKPWRRSVDAASVSRANGSSSPRSQAAAGIENPRLRPFTIRSGRSGATALRRSTFFRKPRTFRSSGSARANPDTSGSRYGTRASSECAIDARSVFTSRSSTRYSPRSTSWSRASNAAPSVSAKRARSTSTGSNAPRRPVSSARPAAEKISFHAWCRSSGGRCAARTNRFAR